MGFLKKLGKGLGKVAKASVKVGLKGAGGGVGGIVAGKVAKKILGGNKKAPSVRPRNDGTSNMERQPRRVDNTPGKGSKSGMSERMQRVDKYTTPPRSGRGYRNGGKLRLK